MEMIPRSTKGAQKNGRVVLRKPTWAAMSPCSKRAVSMCPKRSDDDDAVGHDSTRSRVSLSGAGVTRGLQAIATSKRSSAPRVEPSTTRPVVAEQSASPRAKFRRHRFRRKSPNTNRATPSHSTPETNRSCRTGSATVDACVRYVVPSPHRGPNCSTRPRPANRYPLKWCARDAAGSVPLSTWPQNRVATSRVSGLNEISGPIVGGVENSRQMGTWRPTSPQTPADMVFQTICSKPDRKFGDAEPNN